MELSRAGSLHDSARQRSLFPPTTNTSTHPISFLRDCESRTTSPVAPLVDDRVPAPVDLDPGPLKGEECDDGCDGDAAGEGRGEDVVVFLPPAEVAFADEDWNEV